MIWIVLCVFAVHSVTAFLLSYCFDTAELWKDDKAPVVHTPSIYDLPEDCGRHTMNEYINNEIVPAHKYFSLKSEIEDMQNTELEPILVYLVAHTFPTGLIGYFLFKMDVMPWFLCFSIPLIVCIALSFLAHLVYKKSRLVIRSNDENKASMRRRYDEMKEHHERVMSDKFRFTEFEIDEETDFNNFVINQHYSYLAVLRSTVEKRYFVRKVIYFICTAIYILFIWRVPN